MNLFEKFKKKVDPAQAVKEKGKWSDTEDTIASFNKSGRSKFSPKMTESILRDYGYSLMQEMVEFNRGAYLPLNFGVIRVVGAKTKAVNKPLSSEFKKKIYHRNNSTGGYVFRAEFKFGFNFKLRQLFRFESSFGTKKAIKEQLKESYNHFSTFDNFRKGLH